MKERLLIDLMKNELYQHYSANGGEMSSYGILLTAAIKIATHCINSNMSIDTTLDIINSMDEQVMRASLGAIVKELEVIEYYNDVREQALYG